jgi:hypothetical protein
MVYWLRCCVSLEVTIFATQNFILQKRKSWTRLSPKVLVTIMNRITISARTTYYNSVKEADTTG